MRAQNLPPTSNRYSHAQTQGGADGTALSPPKPPAPAGELQQPKERLLTTLHPNPDNQVASQVEDRDNLFGKGTAEVNRRTISTPATGSINPNATTTAGSTIDAATRRNNMYAGGGEARPSLARAVGGALYSLPVASNQATGGNPDQHLGLPREHAATPDLSRNRRTYFKLGQPSGGIPSVSRALCLGDSEFSSSTTGARGVPFGMAARIAGLSESQRDTSVESKVLTASSTTPRSRLEDIRAARSSAVAERASEMNTLSEDVRQPTSATVASPRDGHNGRCSSSKHTSVPDTTLELDSTTSRNLTRPSDRPATTPAQGQSVPAADADMPAPPPPTPASIFGPRLPLSSLHTQSPPCQQTSNPASYANAMGSDMSKTLLPPWKLQSLPLSATPPLSPPPRPTTTSPSSSPNPYRKHEQRLSEYRPGLSGNGSSGSAVPVSRRRKWQAGPGAPPVPQSLSTGANWAPEISCVSASAESSITPSGTSTTCGRTNVVSAMLHPDVRTLGLAASHWQFDVDDCVGPADYERGGGEAGTGRRDVGSDAGTAGLEAGKGVWCGLHREEGAVLRSDALCCFPGCRARWTWGYAGESAMGGGGQSAPRSCTEHKHHG